MSSATRRSPTAGGVGWTQQGESLLLKDPGAALSDPAGLAALRAATTEARSVSWGTTTLHLHLDLDRKLWQLVLQASERAAASLSAATVASKHPPAGALRRGRSRP